MRHADVNFCLKCLIVLRHFVAKPQLNLGFVSLLINLTVPDSQHAGMEKIVALNLASYF